MDIDLARRIGSQARVARTRLGLSQADAAERAGISAEFYARIERGGTLPSAPTLVALANALEVPTDVLVGRMEGRASATRRAGERLSVQDSPEIRRLLRRARHATPRALRLLNLLAAELTDKHGSSSRRR
jgi:transcriptional regulator with XRE-family HTH domain